MAQNQFDRIDFFTGCADLDLLPLPGHS